MEKSSIAVLLQLPVPKEKDPNSEAVYYARPDRGVLQVYQLAEDYLPIDEDLTRVIKHGIRGTQMAGYDLPG